MAVETIPAAGEASPPGEAAPPRRPFRSRRALDIAASPVAARVVVGVVATVLVVVLFEVLVTQIMYRERQEHLAADFAVGRNVVRDGDATGVLQIPKLDLNVMVIEGDSVENLRAGPAHRSSSPLPGANGNAVVLGHRSRYGGPFGDLSQLAAGDEVFVRSRTDKAPRPVRYVVNDVRVVRASDTTPLDNVEDDRRLTLITSAGGIMSADRLVVVATTDPDPCLAGARGEPPTQPCGAAAPVPPPPPPPTTDEPGAPTSASTPSTTVSSPITIGDAATGGYDAGRASPVFNLGMLGLYALGFFVVLGGRELARRYRPGVVALALAAPVVLAVFLFLLNVDNVLVTTK